MEPEQDNKILHDFAEPPPINIIAEDVVVEKAVDDVQRQLVPGDEDEDEVVCE